MFRLLSALLFSTFCIGAVLAGSASNGHDKVLEGAGPQVQREVAGAGILAPDFSEDYAYDDVEVARQRAKNRARVSERLWRRYVKSTRPQAMLPIMCPHPDYDALMALYNATDGPNWTNNTGWVDGAAGTDCDPCSWRGIGCDGDGRVISISLSNNQLDGSLPVELGQLINLEILNLPFNELTGSIPAEMGQLSTVKELELYRNQLTGNLPSELGQLSNLEVLYISSNQLTGSIPAELGQLGNLERLYLSSNQFTGNIPSELGQLINLEYLSLFSNQLTGSIPPELGQLSSLEVLILYSNRLTGNIPSELGQLSTLLRLNLTFNQLTGDIPSELGQLSNLEELSIGINQLTGTIPTDFGQLSNLERLYLSNNQLTGSIPSELGQLSALLRLDLTFNQLTGSIPLELGQLSNLTELYLNDNELRGSIPSELGQLGSLIELFLESNDLSGNLPPELGQLTRLNKLYLHSNNLSGCYPDEFSVFCSLGVGDTLSVFANGYSFLNNPLLPYQGDYERACNAEPQVGATCDDGDPETDTDVIYDDCGCGRYACDRTRDSLVLVELYNATNGPVWANSNNWLTTAPLEDWFGIVTDGDCIVRINLGFAQLTGNIPSALGQLSKLEHLNLFFSQLTGNIPSELGNLTNLESLVLFNNQLTGIIPPELGQLVNLESLSLLNNQLTGSIPAELGHLINLKTLSLSNNQLTGIISPEFGEILDLTELALGDNRLTGSIPSELGNFSKLERLALHNNRLTGSIPPELGRLSSLEYTFLTNNQLTGSIPPELGDVSSLKGLSLDNNRLTGSIPPELGRLSNLEVLFLDNNQLTGSLPAELGQLSNLIRLYLHSNNLSDCYPDEFSTFCSLGVGDTSDVFVNGYSFLNNSLLPYQGDYERVCNAEPQIGANCDDGNPTTENDIIQANCSCAGEILPTCDDGMQNGDEEGIDCGGTNCAPCPCTHPDYDALMALYDATDGPNWTNNTGWVDGAAGTDCDPCTGWLGVSCDGNNRVTCLDLDGDATCSFSSSPGGNGLTGTLPDEIGELTELRDLFFGGNNIVGAIPVTIGQLSDLERLFLRDNNITGSVPAEIGQMTSLTNVNISSNQLSGSIPPEIGQLTALRILNLSSNDLFGTIPDEIGQMTGLEYLYLQFNDLTGGIPDEIAQATNLIDLDVSFNLISNSIPSEIGQLASLMTLTLRNNNITGAIPPELSQLSNLTHLRLNDNQLSGNIFPEIGQLNNLVILWLSNNELTGSIPSEIGQMTSLASFGASENQLTGEIPAEVAQLSNLTRLYLNNNQLSGCFAPELLNLCAIGVGDPATLTVGYNIEENPELPWQGDMSQFCGTNGSQIAQVGVACNDGDPATENDVIQSDCSCSGQLSPTCPTGTTITVTSDADAGPGTLREAINCANADPDLDNIVFDPGLLGPDILLVSPLPAITDPGVLIDGTGSGSVFIYGFDLTGAANGLEIRADDVRLNQIWTLEFPKDGMLIEGNNATIENCFSEDNGRLIFSGTGINVLLGSDNLVISSTRVRSNENGIMIDGVAGFDVSDCTIEANGGYGLDIINSQNGTINRNFNRTSVSGGIRLQNSSQITAEENIVQGSGGAGVLVNGNSNNISFTGNFIGTDNTGIDQGVLGHGFNIGGTARNITLSGNDIFFNNLGGVWIDTGADEVLISQNRFACNDIFGINLVGSANANLSSPTLSLAATNRIEGFSGTFFTDVEIFRVNNNDCSGNNVCQGYEYLGTAPTVGGIPESDAFSFTPATDLSIGDEIVVVTIDDENNRSSIFSTCITVSGTCPDAFAAGPATGCGDPLTYDLTALNADVVGGQSGLTVTWSEFNGFGNTEITDPANFQSGFGNNSVTATTNNGLCSSTGVTVQLSPAANNPLATNANLPSEVCVGEDITVTVNISGGTPPYSGDFFISPEEVETFTNFPGGDYTFTFTLPEGDYTYFNASFPTVQDASGCFNSAAGSGTLSVTAPPTVSAPATAPVCLNGLDNLIDLTQYDNDLGGGAQVQWWLNSSATQPVPDPTDYLFETAGTVTLYAVVGTGSCTSAPIAVPFTVAAPPSITADPPLDLSGTFCLGDELITTLTFNGGTPPYTGSISTSAGVLASWQDISGPLEVMISFDVAGDYSYTNSPFSLQDANGCAEGVGPQVEFFYSVSPALSLSCASTPATAGQPDGTITLTASGGVAPYSYTINPGNLTGSFASENTTVPGLGAGSYEVILASGEGECMEECMVVVSETGGGNEITVTNAPEDDLFLCTRFSTYTIAETDTYSTCFLVDSNSGAIVPGSVSAGLAQRLNLGSESAVVPTFTGSCSAQIQVCVADVPTFGEDAQCDPIIVSRSFTATADGCTEAFVIVQYVFRRPGLNELIGPDAIVDFSECGAANPAREDYPAPRPADYPRIISLGDTLHLIDGQAVCNIGLSFTDGDAIVTCPYSYKFVRTYTVLDWCNPSEPRTFTQVIKVGENLMPSFAGPSQDLDGDGEPDGGPLIYATNTGNSCDVLIRLDDPSISLAGPCGGEGSLNASVYLENSQEEIGPFELDLSAGQPELTSPIPLGNHVLRYRYEDVCGNGDSTDFNIVVLDSPPPICIQTLTVTLMPDGDGGGDATINSSDFIAALVDDCEGNPITEYSIHRETAALSDGFIPDPALDQVDFTCADFGNVTIRVYAHNEVPGYADYCSVVVEVQRFNTNICNSTEPNCNRTQDSLSLVALYNATNGPGWTRSDNWLTTAPLEDWYGITTDGDCIVEVSLVDNLLTGNIPAEIGQLSKLEALNLNMNELSGSIPTDFGNLPNLRVLSLSTNQLTGNIPTEIGSLTDLQSLYLDNNQLDGSVPAELGGLVNLTALWLQGNEFGGSIPAEFGGLLNLRILHLDNNQLTGRIPVEIGSLRSLRNLYLHNNQLTGSIPVEIGSLVFLRNLWLDNNQLTGNIPAEFGGLFNLDQLFLDNNQLTGSIPPDLGQLSNLDGLSLNNNQLTGSIPAELGQLSELNGIYFQDNQLTGSIPLEFGQLNSLDAIVLFNNELTGNIPAEIGQLNNLRGLYLHSNQLTGSIPPELGQLNNLIGLYLHNNQMTGCYPSAFTDLICPLSPADTSDISSGGGYSFLNNPGLPYQGDYERICNGDPQTGAPCNDGNPETENDVIDGDCNCTGTLLDLTAQDVALTGTETTGGIGEEVCVYFVADTLPEVLSAQFTVIFPTEQLEFSRAFGQLDDEDAVVVNSNPGIIGYAVFIFGTEGYSALNDTLLEACFTILDTSRAEVSITDSPTPFEIYDENNNFIPHGILTSAFINPQNNTTCSDGIMNGIETGIDCGGDCPSCSACNRTQDSLALVALYNATNGPGWVNSDNWLTTAPLEDWYGLSTDGNCVIAIDLRNNGLIGTLPAEFWNLIGLESLRLQRNQIGGELSGNIGELRELRTLYLNENLFSGSIPSEIGQLTFLDWLDLSRNSFTGTIPTEVSQLTSLRYLNFGYNQLAGSIPAELGQMSALERLLLNNNQLTGGIPTELDQLDNISYFYLHSNLLEGCIPVGLADVCSLNPGDTTSIDAGYSLLNNPRLPFQGDYERVCDGEVQIGAPCDDGNIYTFNDSIDAECNCQGQPFPTFCVDDGCGDLLFSLESMNGEVLFCEGDTIKIENNSEQGFDFFVVDWGYGPIDTINTYQTIEHIVDTAGCSQLVIEPRFTGYTSCEAGVSCGTATIVFAIRPTPRAQAVIPSTVSAGEVVEYISSSCSTTSVTWDFGNDVSIVGDTISYGYPEEGIYTIRLIATGDEECSVTSDTLEQVIEVLSPTCTDGIQNGTETDIDCGGPDCSPCNPYNNFTLVASNETGSSGEEVCLDINVFNFDSLAGFQFRIAYDAEKLTYLSAQSMNLQPDVEVSNPAPGELRVLWFDPTISPNSIQDGESILSLCFTVLQPCSTVLDIVEAPTEFEPRATNSDGEVVTIDVINGSVNAGIPLCTDQLTFEIGSADAAVGEQVCLPVRVYQAIDLVSFQYSMVYDPAVLNYLGSNPPFPLNDFSTTNINHNLPGLFRTAWADPLANPNTLTDGAVIYELCFEVLSSSPTVIYFEDGPTAIEFEDVNGLLEADLVNGAVNGSNTPVIGLTEISQPSCQDGNDGSIALTVSGSNLRYEWSPNVSNGATATGLEAGTYNLTITNQDNDQSVMESFTVNDPGPFDLAVVILEDVSCFGAADGSIILSIIGDTGPYLFDWSGSLPDDVMQQNDLTGGAYSVSVTDANGCVQSLNNIGVGEPALLNVTGAITNIPSPSPGNIDVTVAGGSGPFEYSWTGPNSYTSNEEDPDDITEPGTYCVTVTDTNECEDTQCFAINMALAIVQADVTGNCGSGDCSIDVTVGGGLGGYSYQWTFNGAIIAITEDLATCEAGDYLLRVISGQDTVTQTITVAPETTIVATTTVISDTEDVACSGMIELDISGGLAPYEVSWSAGNLTLNGAIIVQLCAGTYTPTVTDAAGCSIELMPIILGRIDEAVESITDVNCADGENGAINLTISGGVAPYTFQWFITGESDALTDTEDLTGVPAGDYTISIKDATGAQMFRNYSIGVSAAFSIMEQVTSDYSGFGVSCFGANDGALQIISNGETDLTYEISYGGEVIGVDSVLDNLAAGTYLIVASDEGGCEISRSVEITAPPVLAISAVLANNGCGSTRDGNIALTVSGGVEPYEYLWSTGSSTDEISALSSGEYSVTVTDENGCTEEATYVLTENFNITIDSMLCADESISVNGRTYNMDNPSGREELQTIAGCDSIININLSFYDELRVENIPVSLCVGDTLRYNNEVISVEAGLYERLFTTQDGNCDSLQLLWNVTLVSVDSTIFQDTICIGDELVWNSLSLTTPGRYEAIRSNSSGDCELIEVLYLTVISPEDLLVTDDSYALQRSDESLLMPLLLNDTVPYLYDIEVVRNPDKGTVEFMDDNIFFIPDGVEFGPDSFRYEICFAQCPDFCEQAWVRLDIDFNCILEFTLNIPNGFTPNGDGKNDFFDPVATISGDCLDQLGGARMAIRNIQSEIVFEASGDQPRWDGTDKKGRMLPIGTYWYIFEIEGQEDVISGAVELVR